MNTDPKQQIYDGEHELDDFTKSKLSSVKRIISGYLASIITFILFGFVGWNVDQIRLLIVDVFKQDLLIVLITVLLFLWGCLLLAYFLVRSPESTWIDRLLTRLPVSLRDWVGTPLRWVIGISTQGLFRLAKLGRKFSEGVSARVINLTVISIGLAVAWLCPLSPSWTWFLESIWPLPGGFFRMAGLLAFAVATWLWFGTRFGPTEVLDGGEEGNGTTQRHIRVWRRTGEVLSVLIILAVVLEILWIAVECFAGVSMTVYTVWAFFCLAFAGVAIALLLDYLNRHTSWPWRLTALVILLVVVSLPSHVELGSSDTPDNAGVLQSATPDTWVDAALDRLDAEPEGPVIIITASGGGSRAALVAALTLGIIEEEFRSDGDRPACIWLASGVSGGSLALAAHYHPSEWQASTEDAVTRDYLGPLFRGFLTPFENRGESLTAYWDRSFPWDSIDQTITDPSKPLLVMGVADIDTGRRVMVGFPRLPEDWFYRYRLVRTKDGQSYGLSEDDHQPYSLSTLRSEDDLPNVRLTRGVRMSSSFPFGFEPTRLIVDVPTPNNKPVDHVHFLDGGMVDNTGVDSVLAILSTIDELSSENSLRLKQDLRRRGILLIEIDAGAGSGEVTRSGPASRVTQPFGGYNRGVYSAAKRARDRNVDALKLRFGDDFTTEPIKSYPENDQVDEIMTTLALPTKDVQRLIRSFKDQKTLAAIRKALHERYSYLSARDE